MYRGVDYYPDYWPEDLMEEDINGIKRLGANIVRIGEFAWHRMEPQEGAFDFSYFDRVIARLKENGLKVMFGIPTATFPAWLAKKHPDILSEDEAGQVRVFGGRRQYCYNSPEYRRYSKRIAERLVSHYRDESAIVAWQVDNEFGHEGSDMCYCPRCHRAFQAFLRDTYGSIGILNETYGSIFWGQTYNGFEEIPLPKKTITTHNPSLLLDWARFRSRSLNRFAGELTEVVRRCKGEHQQVTTNVSGGFFDKWFDHEENVRLMDFVSYDNYPVWGGRMEPLPPAAVAMAHDFNRCLLDQPYWIVEELIGAQGHQLIGYLPRPGQAKLWSYQAFAHGCAHMLYFNWRSMTKGAEQFCHGIIGHDNQYGRKFDEVREVFQEIAPFEDLLASEIRPEIAVLYDYDNIWSWRFQPQTEGFDFTRELLRLYTPFFKLNAQIDVIPVTRDFSRYRVLVVPVLQIIGEELAERLRLFAAQGGTLLFSFRTGLRDRHNNILFNRPQPGYVAELCGIRIDEAESLSTGPGVPIVGKGPYAGRRSVCTVWRDLITPLAAEVLYAYDDPFFPHAAVTRHRHGEGMVYYVGGGLGEDVLDALAADIVTHHNIWHSKSEPDVEVYVRTCGSDRYLFVMNHAAEERTHGHLTLAPFECRIVKLDEGGHVVSS